MTREDTMPIRTRCPIGPSTYNDTEFATPNIGKVKDNHETDNLKR